VNSPPYILTLQLQIILNDFSLLILVEASIIVLFITLLSSFVVSLLCLLCRCGHMSRLPLSINTYRPTDILTFTKSQNLLSIFYVVHLSKIAFEMDKKFILLFDHLIFTKLIHTIANSKHPNLKY